MARALGVGVASHDDAGEVRIHLPQPLEHDVPWHLWQSEIEQHHLRVVASCDLEGLGAVRSQTNRIAQMDQGVVEKFGDARLIVHDQHSDERSGHGSSRMEGYAARD
jgi:hypothetical protein